MFRYNNFQLIPLRVSPDKFKFPRRCVCDGFVSRLAALASNANTLFQVYLFSVKSCCCRVAPHAYCPRRADIAREEWELLLLITNPEGKLTPASVRAAVWSPTNGIQLWGSQHLLSSVNRLQKLDN
jgi:hypothetical protein